MDDSLENFIKKAKNANAMGTKELRFSAKEIMDLALTIDEILTINLKLNNKIRELESLIGSSVKIDGGKL